jgi:hypothetical protein
MAREPGWILGVWEGDTQGWAEWFRVDDAEIVLLNRAAPPPSGPVSLLIYEPTPVYSATMDPLWIAQPGEWYDVLSYGDGWALARREGDPPGSEVWIQEGPAFEYQTPDSGHQPG